MAYHSLVMKHWPAEEGKLLYEYRVTATAADIDANNHVNNVVYIRWVQEAAETHWRSAADAALVAEVAWVVVSHEIEYKKPAWPGETLSVRTWVEQGTMLTSERHCRIMRGDELLARVRTVWCAVNPASGKPRRLPPRVNEIFCAGH